MSQTDNIVQFPGATEFNAGQSAPLNFEVPADLREFAAGNEFAFNLALTCCNRTMRNCRKVAKDLEKEGILDEMLGYLENGSTRFLMMAQIAMLAHERLTIAAGREELAAD
jgi:hypothetical protein